MQNFELRRLDGPYFEASRNRGTEGHSMKIVEDKDGVSRGDPRETPARQRQNDKAGLAPAVSIPVRERDRFKDRCCRPSAKTTVQAVQFHRQRQFWYCFHCSNRGDLVDLVALLENVDVAGAMNVLLEKRAKETQDCGEQSETAIDSDAGDLMATTYSTNANFNFSQRAQEVLQSETPEPSVSRRGSVVEADSSPLPRSSPLASQEESGGTLTGGDVVQGGIWEPRRIAVIGGSEQERLRVANALARVFDADHVKVNSLHH